MIDYVKIDAKHSFEDTTYPITEYNGLYGDRVTLLGGIDVDKMSRLPDGKLGTYVRNRIREYDPSGSFAFSSENTITNYIRINNYLAMLDKGKKYSVYPIQ